MIFKLGTRRYYLDPVVFFVFYFGDGNNRGRDTNISMVRIMYSTPSMFSLFVFSNDRSISSPSEYCAHFAAKLRPDVDGDSFSNSRTMMEPPSSILVSISGDYGKSS